MFGVRVQNNNFELIFGAFLACFAPSSWESFFFLFLISRAQPQKEKAKKKSNNWRESNPRSHETLLPKDALYRSATTTQPLHQGAGTAGKTRPEELLAIPRCGAQGRGV